MIGLSNWMLRTDHAALAGSGGRTGANKVRRSWRGGAGPRGDGHRARWVGGGESARGSAWGAGGANTRRWGASGAQPVPAGGAELRARGRGFPGLPGGFQVREEEKKGSGAGASAGRRDEEGTPPFRAGRANGGGGG